MAALAAKGTTLHDYDLNLDVLGVRNCPNHVPQPHAERLVGVVSCMSLQPIPLRSSDELPLQGSIQKTVCYGYELKEGRELPRRYENRIQPVLPVFVRDSEAEATMRLEGW